MVAFLLFFADFLLFAMFTQWIVHSLLAYVVVKQVLNGATTPFTFCSTPHHFFILFLLILEDFFLYGRFCFLLIWFIPALFFAHKIRKLIVIHKAIMISLVIITILFVDNLFIAKIFFSRNINFFMTITKIFTTLIVGMLVFLGLRSNRSFFIKKRGKSGLQTGWMPHKKVVRLLSASHMRGV